MYHLGEIVTFKASRMSYETIGMVINKDPIICRLPNGSHYTVKNAEVHKIDSELQNLLEDEFK